MSRYFVILYVFFGWISTLKSQVINIENKRIYDDSIGWSGALAGKIAALQNRDLYVNLEFKPRVQYKTKKQYYLLFTELSYSKGGAVYANSGMTHFRFAQRIKTGPWKWESFAQVQYNVLLLQRVRNLYGTGLRVKWLDNKAGKAFVGSSVFFEYEEIRQTNDFSNEYNADVRWSNYVSCFFATKNDVRFTAATYYQPKINDFSDYRISGQYTLLFHLAKKTDFKFEITGLYDSRPPIGVRNLIFDTSVGIVYRIED